MPDSIKLSLFNPINDLLFFVTDGDIGNLAYTLDTSYPDFLDWVLLKKQKLINELQSNLNQMKKN